MGIPTDMRRTTTVAAFSCGSASGYGKRHSPYPATYRSYMADAAWGSYVAVSGLSGHEREALRDTYGHHHPDFLREAANTIGSRPIPPKKVALVVSLVEEKAKRAGVSQPTEFIGRPGRTRTCNQTVMSGPACRLKKFSKINSLIDSLFCSLVQTLSVHVCLFAFMHVHSVH
jgi:hypothetical protein